MEGGSEKLMVDEFDESGTISRTGVEDIFCAKIG